MTKSLRICCELFYELVYANYLWETYHNPLEYRHIMLIVDNYKLAIQNKSRV